ncbi:hypothetical protein H2200_006744 [Cladophialophora chaetospira]|uniref:N,N-dimethylformamidase beta subunit-like C-terminal domain-containing protein n=1 Tax=Cladophialophora chaetospira TaxID=386627 RepID=A0AA38X8S8_9EURO|nr:hypothetical protein H2200_006744 [Cladophialophora chaetospira]
MATIVPVPAGYPAEITGYVEPWIVDPGDTVQVSCTEPEYSYCTVRVIQGVDLPHSPKKELEEITSIPSGRTTGRFQVARCGSCALVQNWLTPAQADKLGLEVSLFFQPHLVLAGHTQSIVSTLDVPTNSGFAIVITSQGLVELWLDDGHEVHVLATDLAPRYKRWIGVRLVLEQNSASLSLEPVQFVCEKTPAAVQLRKTLERPLRLLPTCTLLFAASNAESRIKGSSQRTSFFNGRIDAPLIKSLQDGIIARYDFSRNIPDDGILDISSAGHHGVLINAPARGVRGHDWDGTEVDWTKAKSGYGAIHFHEDDLDDAAGRQILRYGFLPTRDPASTRLRLPDETRSKTASKIALILPTFTYLAYANDKLGDSKRSSSGGTGAALCDIAPTPTVDSDRNHRRLDLGVSTYDVHNDGSGNVFSTSKRPIMNFRPGFVSYGLGRPLHVSAESIMIGFLERERLPYDVLTDHDLHSQGVSALLPYDVAITGGHPEYPTNEVYDAYQQYANRGGNLMYLGGNGFYWVTGFDPARPWRIEIRRGESGVRSYSLDPGEWHLSLDGRLGGLWRSRGRSSHALFGVAFCAQGRPPGVPYKRTNAGNSPLFDWMFARIPDGELIGQQGLGGGASGDEMDSIDIRHGSPLNGVVVATSIEHSDGFGIASECVSYPILATRGTETREVRSDMVYYETNAGGAVFSVGSINWYPSLGWDDYDNNVARLTVNVIREFLRRPSQHGEQTSLK